MQRGHPESAGKIRIQAKLGQERVPQARNLGFSRETESGETAAGGRHQQMAGPAAGDQQ